MFFKILFLLVFLLQSVYHENFHEKYLLLKTFFFCHVRYFVHWLFFSSLFLTLLFLNVFCFGNFFSPPLSLNQFFKEMFFSVFFLKKKLGKKTHFSKSVCTLFSCFF